MILLVFGVIILVCWFAIITAISHDEERGAAAVAFILGIVGAAFICASRG